MVPILDRMRVGEVRVRVVDFSSTSVKYRETIIRSHKILSCKKALMPLSI